MAFLVLKNLWTKLANLCKNSTEATSQEEDAQLNRISETTYLLTESKYGPKAKTNQDKMEEEKSVAPAGAAGDTSEDASTKATNQEDAQLNQISEKEFLQIKSKYGPKPMYAPHSFTEEFEKNRVTNQNGIEDEEAVAPAGAAGDTSEDAGDDQWRLSPDPTI